MHSERVSDGEHERCAACGFDGSRYDDASLLASIGELGARWRALLSEAGPDLRTRPDADTWSAIEYAAHSRDIAALHAFGVGQALTEDEPAYPAIDGDALIATAAASYGDENAEAVVDQLDRETRGLRDVAADAGTALWWRGVTVGENRSSIRRLLEHALHDSSHHLRDVERGLATIRR